MRELRQEAETPQLRSSSAYPLPPSPEQHEAEEPTPMVVQPQLHQPPEATIIQQPEPPVPEVPLDDVELAPEDDVELADSCRAGARTGCCSSSTCCCAATSHRDGMGHDREPAPGPYLTEFQEVSLRGPIDSMTLRNPSRATSEDDSSDDSGQEPMAMKGNPKIADAFMTGRAAWSEVNLKELSA